MHSFGDAQPVLLTGSQSVEREPQTPPLHDQLQHWDALEQKEPSLLQAGGPQTPLLHWPVQHWDALEQEEPLLLQAGGPQTPLLHSLVQHSEASVQPLPSGRQR